MGKVSTWAKIILIFVCLFLLICIDASKRPNLVTKSDKTIVSLTGQCLQHTFGLRSLGAATVSCPAGCVGLRIIASCLGSVFIISIFGHLWLHWVWKLLDWLIYSRAASPRNYSAASHSLRACVLKFLHFERFISHWASYIRHKITERHNLYIHWRFFIYNMTWNIELILKSWSVISLTRVLLRCPNLRETVSFINLDHHSRGWWV